MGDWSSHTDLQLIEAVRAGRKDAFTELVERHRKAVAATVRGMLGNVMEADDVGQEVFVRFYHSLGKFRGDSQVRTYLTRIAINLSLNEIKRNKRKGRVFRTGEDDSMGNIADSHDQGSGSDLKELLDRAIATLDPGFRTVVVLRLIEGYSVKDTAAILGMAEGTVLSRLYRAQMKLREVLSPYM